MKAKLLTVVLMTVFCLGLAGCGNNAQDAGNDKNTESGSVDLKKDQILIEGMVVALDDSVDVIKDKLGEPLEYSESKSCMYDGYDKVYTYADVEIITYPKDGGEYINSITILSDKVESGCGIVIGDASEVITTNYKEEEMVITKSCYMYETDDFGMAFYVDNDVVTEIEIYTIEE